jgi:phospholipid/cholesterol/gamma-HCH transport system substrate-binding protein
MSANRRVDNISLGLKLLLFAGLSVILTTIVVASVLDLDTNSTKNYRAYFTNVTGLESGDTVRIAGVEVGKVNAVAVMAGAGALQQCGLPADPQDPSSVTCARVSFSLNTNQHITSTTGAQIFYANLLGQRFMALTPGGSPGSPLRSGASIPIDQTKPGLDLTEVFNGFEPLFNALAPSEVNELSASIIQVFQGESGTVSSLVAQTASITNNLADRQQVLDQVLQNLAGLLNAVNGQGTQLGQLIDNFSTLVSGLANQRTQLAGTIDGISQLNTNVAGLLQSSQPAFNQSIDGLASATATLSTDQSQLQGLVQGIPGLFTALTRIVDTGSYINVYLCNLTININGSINIALGGQGSPQFPANDTLPSGAVGDQSIHTRNCG